ncbi:MAG: enoyl-[acyl-carrier-protein] reductase FabL [Anaerolineae bacterium]|nr:enoyl-[acyl-carrier-protein] reductase FabL [Anaerolineae bacterium]
MENPLDFTGKTALVTGSGRGIGRAIALKLAELGAHVVINYVHNQEPAEEAAAQIRALGRQALAVRANVGKEEGLKTLFGQIGDQFGRLDFFISNAASGFNRPALQQKESGWDHTLNVNARGFLFAAQLAVPLMPPEGGKIVAITSPGAERVLPDYVAVGASKAALNALVRYLAVELAPRHINVNAVSPGIIETDALQHFSFMQDDQVIPRAIANTPAGRLVLPEDIANAVAFLCSPLAEMMCGQVLIVDGGYTLPVPH